MSKRSEFQLRVDSFMEKARQELPDSPCIPSEGVRRLRASLILEEALETIEALGFGVRTERDHQFIDIDDCLFLPIIDADMVKIADGCCDTMVVTLGTLSACGMSDCDLMTEVCDSNDSKFIDGHIRDDGKLIKGPAYRPADLVPILVSQSAAGVS
jgi:predicted HAD superfamily Cof-like phosphohydrolase